MFVGRKEWPMANTKPQHEKTKKAPKIGNLAIFQNFEKQKKCVSIPDSFDPTCQKLGSYAKNCDL